MGRLPAVKFASLALISFPHGTNPPFRTTFVSARELSLGLNDLESRV